MTRRTMADATTVTNTGAEVINNNLAVFQVSENQSLATPLMGLKGQFDAAARANTAAAIQNAGGEFTLPEIDAMVQVEALRLVNGLDLTAVLLRAHYLMEIQRRGLLAQHPAHYASLDQMARDNGMTVTGLSQTLDLVNIIFPYVQNELGIPVYEFWEKLGSSKVKELLAVLKAIITGNDADRGQTRTAVEAAMNEATDLMRATRPDLFEDNLTEEQTDELDAEVRRAAVDNLITMAEGAETVRAVRATLRPTRTPMVDIYEVPMNGENVYVLQLTGDQLDMIRNKLGERAQILHVENARRASLQRIPVFRRILDVLNGQ